MIKRHFKQVAEAIVRWQRISRHAYPDFPLLYIQPQRTNRDTPFILLHADSELPPDWDRKVRGLLEDETIALGYFRFAIRERIAGAGWVEWSANLRSKILKRPYGDQALFLNRCTFERLGGYRDVPILEDLYLVKDAARLGRVRGVPAPVLTSGRRWIAHGVLRTTIINHAVIIAAAAGADLDDLHAAYRAGRNPLRHRCQPDPADGA